MSARPTRGSRYTHRVAISNSRIVNVAGGQVTFRYKDYADEHRTKTMTVSGDEFCAASSSTCCRAAS